MIYIFGLISLQFLNPSPCNPNLDIKRAIRWPQVMHRDEQDIDDGPDAQASEAEQLANPLLPVAQVESIGAKAAQSEADQQGGGGFGVGLRCISATGLKALFRSRG